ncbi:MAG: Hsp20/alpha crystallin family protein [Syntrophaceae bacterium]|nr:Hsp20/alpha crystallin family protein [Syntrophaceae bacterium]
MANLMKWDPIKDLAELSWDLDRFFRDFMETSGFSEEEIYSSPPVESFRRNGSFVVKVELPGVSPQDVQLNAGQGCLTIEGERKREKDIPEESWVRQELWYGQFRRTIPIPEGVKTDEIQAKYHDGILEITAPIDEHYLPKKIEVEVPGE